MRSSAPGCPGARSRRDHFVFHYPLELEEWTRAVAAARRRDRLGGRATRRLRADARRRTSSSTIRIRRPNGSAWPFLERPVIDLWAAPPDPRDDIGEFRDWGEMLVVARVRAHRAPHASVAQRGVRDDSAARAAGRRRPDRDPRAALGDRRLRDLRRRRVTGSGRPHGVWRPAFLRQWALEGQLPRYEQLECFRRVRRRRVRVPRGLGVSRMAGRAARRLESRRRVATDDGATESRASTKRSPACTANRPRAVRTVHRRPHRQGTRDRRRDDRASARTPGTIVQRLSWYTGDPAISPDGQRVAILAALADRAVANRRLEHAPPSRTRGARGATRFCSRAIRRTFPRERSIRRPSACSRAFARAPALRTSRRAFLRDGRVLVSRVAPRGDGSFAPDLFIWDVQRGSVHRVTHGASLSNGDPLPERAWRDRDALPRSVGASSSPSISRPARFASSRKAAPRSRTFVRAFRATDREPSCPCTRGTVGVSAS